MATKAPIVSSAVIHAMEKSTMTKIRNGTPKPKAKAFIATPREAVTTTRSPTCNCPQEASPKTSTIFSLLSDALQYPATLQDAQADVCSILTFMQSPLTESTIPECLILSAMPFMSRA